MKRSTDRILTTHAGSLARPDPLRTMLIDRDEGRPYDQVTFATQVRGAVGEVVRRQIAVGIDIVNDGEQSKRNFTTYARERLGGIEERVLEPGERVLAMIYGRDAREFPEYFAGRGTLAGREAVCTGPLRYIGGATVQADIAGFKAALAGVEVTEAFLPAVAPGTIEHWLRNEHYGSDEAYLSAIADAMKMEYDTIVQAGFLLQIDDPDLADAWQIYPDMSVAEYRKFAGLRIEALNHALRDIPPERVRFHVCWGSYHGPQRSDLRAASTSAQRPRSCATSSVRRSSCGAAWRPPTRSRWPWTERWPAARSPGGLPRAPRWSPVPGRTSPSGRKTSSSPSTRIHGPMATR